MKEFAKKIFVAAAALGAIVLAAYIIRLLLLILAGTLLAIIFRGIADWLVRHTRLSPGWSVAVVLAAAIVAIFGTAWEFGSRIAGQADLLLARISQALGSLQQTAQRYPNLHRILLGSNFNFGQSAETLLAKAIWLAAAFVLVLFVAAYTTVNPTMYRDGFMRFFPESKRPLVRSIIDEIGYALKWWILGQLIAMGSVAIIAAIGLLVLGTPMALPLAVLLGILTFIPYVGTIASAIPALLIAFSVSTHMALYVLVVFVIAHVVEGYVITPKVHQRFVYIPPALILANEFLMDLLAGIIGVAFATPFLVVVMVLTQRLYFRRRLMDREAA